MTKIIFDGTLIGKVTRTPTGISIYNGIIASFMIQLKERIEGVPQEILVYAKIRTSDYKLVLTVCMSDGDIVQVHGKIHDENIKFWNKWGNTQQAAKPHHLINFYIRLRPFLFQPRL